jgi:hypothetical protein
VVDAVEHLRGEVRRRRVGDREVAVGDERPCAAGRRVGVLPADVLGGGDVDERPEVGGGLEWVADDVLLGQLDIGLDEAIVERLVDVDALDAAARLPRVVERAVDEVVDGVVEVAVGQDERRVLAAELEADARRGPSP